MKVLIQETYKHLEDEIKELGIEIAQNPTDDVTYLIGNSTFINANSYLPNIDTIQLTHAGYDTLNVEPIINRGIQVLNARGVFSIEIAEFCIAYILMLTKNLPLLKKNQQNHSWDRSVPMTSIENVKVLLMGTGSISQEISKRLETFGSEVYGVNSNGRAIQGFKGCYPLSSLEDYIGDFDIIVAALPDNKDTEHRITAETFRLMKDASIFINVGRGSLVDIHNIEDAISHMAAVVLDVLDPEPFPEDHSLWDLENVYITPHISSKSQYNQKRAGELILENIRLHKENKPLLNMIKLG